MRALGKEIAKLQALADLNHRKVDISPDGKTAVCEGPGFKLRFCDLPLDPSTRKVP